MKRSSLPILLALLSLCSPALAAPFLLVAGTPHPTNNSTFQNITNNASSDYAKGTDFQSTPVDGGVVTHRLRLKNIGGDQLNYTVTENSPDFRAIGPGSVLVPVTGERIFDIEFNPTSAGLKTTTLYINSNDPNTPSFEVNLTGIGTAPEADLFGGSSLDEEIDDGDTTPNYTDRTNFGSLDIFASGRSYFFRLENNGTSDLQFVSGSVTSGQGFTLSSLPAESSYLSPGDGHNFILTFNPSSTGEKNATVTIVTNDSNEGLYTFAVRGTATATPEIEVRGRVPSLSVDSKITNGSTTNLEINGTLFENTEVDATSTNYYRVLNLGTAQLDFEVTVDNPAFKVSLGSGPQSVGFGIENTVNVHLQFSPTTSGTHTGTVTIDNNDPSDDPFTFEVEGFATAPEVTVLGGQNYDQEIVDGDSTPRVGDSTNFLEAEVNGEEILHTFRIKNDGTSTLTFLNASLSPAGQGFYIVEEPSANAMIPPFGYLELTIEFDPFTDGVVDAEVSIVTTDSDETPYSFAITGTGVGDPVAEVLGNYNLSTEELIPPGSLFPSSALGTHFGEVNLGQSSTKRFGLKNAGHGTLNYTIEIEGPGFTLEEDDDTLEPSGFSEFEITFEPTVLGVRSALVTLSSNDPETPSYVFAVEGTGTGPELDIYGGDRQTTAIGDGSTRTSSTDGTAFDSLWVGEPGETHSFLLHNSGDRNLVIASAGPSDNPDFTITGVPKPTSPILPNESATIQITFEPQSAGKKSMEVSIISNDYDENPYTFVVSGVGLDGPEMKLTGGTGAVEIPDGHGTPSDTDGTILGTAAVGFSSSKSFTIENLGNQSLTLGTPSGANAFSAAISGSSSVAPDSSTTLTVTFTPTEAGVRTAFITIPNNDPDEDPYTFAVRAEGFELGSGPDLEIRAPGSSTPIPSGPDSATSAYTDFGTATQGQSSFSKSFVIANTGDSPLENIATSGSWAPGLATTLAAGAEDPFQLTLSTDTPGLVTATVSFTSNDPDENPYVIHLRGVVLPTELPAIEMTLDGADGVFEFQTIEGLEYQITSNTTLEGQWTPEGDSVTGTGNIEQIQIPQLIDPNLSPPRKFYRLELVTP